MPKEQESSPPLLPVYTTLSYIIAPRVTNGFIWRLYTTTSLFRGQLTTELMGCTSARHCRPMC
ncbi:hypothetical protein DPMN_135580 [Dreissena polymorpha]|uniref:Uncharacterized protein n=1 Tax=Dreissena polymorpha TaxID=45954 RepID=A0A9D4JD24_DREPO|nr:hypothetical protein DPMN_135580 [Dreissena polymorpha]